MKDKCEHCGSSGNWWVFLGRDGAKRVCDCQVDLTGATILPRGMSSFLDERLDWVAEALAENNP